MSYRLTGDDITFDSGSIFASDPKFVDLSLSGATVPDTIDMGTAAPQLLPGRNCGGTRRSAPAMSSEKVIRTSWRAGTRKDSPSR
jgi:hypothetical protein